jgi:hypothetical protein
VTAGTHTVTVVNPSPGGTSQGVTFMVTAGGETGDGGATDAGVADAGAEPGVELGDASTTGRVPFWSDGGPESCEASLDCDGYAARLGGHLPTLQLRGGGMHSGSLRVDAGRRRNTRGLHRSGRGSAPRLLQGGRLRREGKPRHAERPQLHFLLAKLRGQLFGPGRVHHLLLQRPEPVNGVAGRYSVQRRCGQVQRIR